MFCRKGSDFWEGGWGLNCWIHHLAHGSEAAMDAPTYITSTARGSLDQAGTGVGINQSSVGLKCFPLGLNWSPPGLSFHSNMMCVLQQEWETFWPDLQASPPTITGAFWRRSPEQWSLAAWWSIGVMLQGGTETARIVPTTTHPHPISCLLTQHRRGQLAFPVQAATTSPVSSSRERQEALFRNWRSGGQRKRECPASSCVSLPRNAGEGRGAQLSPFPMGSGPSCRVLCCCREEEKGVGMKDEGLAVILGR